MSDSPPRLRKPLALAEVVAGVLAPVTRDHRLTAADLMSAWAELAGARYAQCTCPDRIDWPRGADSAAGAVLRVRAEGPRAVLLQHELGQLVERVNAYLGYGAIARVRLVQGPVPRRSAKPTAIVPRAEDEAHATGAVSAVEDEALRAALLRLGRGIFANRG